MKTFLRITFFILLLAQICFGQWELQNPLQATQSKKYSGHFEATNPQQIAGTKLSKSLGTDYNINNRMQSTSQWESKRHLSPNEIYDNQSPTWVRNYYAQDYPVNTSYDLVSFDEEGNIYAFGSTDESFPRTGVSIQSYYDKDGNLKWMKEEKNLFILWSTLDSLGNIYARGVDSLGYFIVKYNPLLTEQWKLYGWENIAVDPAGNVYLTKSQELPGIWQSEIVTAKYNTNGIQQWVVHFSSSFGSMNFPRVLAVDGKGGLVVKGESWSPPNYGNPIIIKYGPDGSEEWNARFTATINSCAADWIAIDDSGSVYIVAPSCN
jgi:hypothetical protein